MVIGLINSSSQLVDIHGSEGFVDYDITSGKIWMFLVYMAPQSGQLSVIGIWGEKNVNIISKLRRGWEVG